MDFQKDIWRFYKEQVPILSGLLSGGIIMRDKIISKAGASSAVIFVPKYLLGQRVKVIIVPEDTEVAGLRKTIDKKIKSISKLNGELKRLRGEESLKSDEAGIDPNKERPIRELGDSSEPDPEEEDAY